MRHSSPSSGISDSVLKVTPTGGGPAMERDIEDSGTFFDSWLFTDVGSVEAMTGELVWDVDRGEGEAGRLECDGEGLGMVIPEGCTSTVPDGANG